MRNSAWLIGRKDADCGHILLDEDTISSNHATLNYQDGKYYLIDNNSKNGTFLVYNNETIHLNQHYEVRLEDELYLGKTRYFLNEIVAFAKLTKGVDSSELIILDGNYNANSSVETPIKVKPEIKPNIEGGKVKRIRCLDCTSPIFSDKVCPKCGATGHLK